MLASAQRTEPLAQASLIGNSVTEHPGTYAMWVNQGTKMSGNFSETHQFNKSFRKQNALICELSTQKLDLSFYLPVNSIIIWFSTLILSLWPFLSVGYINFT